MGMTGVKMGMTGVKMGMTGVKLGMTGVKLGIVEVKLGGGILQAVTEYYPTGHSIVGFLFQSN